MTTADAAKALVLEAVKFRHPFWVMHNPEIPTSIGVYAPELGMRVNLGLYGPDSGPSNSTRCVQLLYLSFGVSELTVALLWQDLVGLIPGLNDRHTVHEYCDPKFPDLAIKQLRAARKKWRSLIG